MLNNWYFSLFRGDSGVGSHFEYRYIGFVINIYFIYNIVNIFFKINHGFCVNKDAVKVFKSFKLRI